MARYKVIKSHDGLEAGTIRVLAPCHVTAEMVRLGYWKEMKDDAKPKAPKKTRKK